MDPQSTNGQELLMVTDFLAGATGPEAFGGPRDGAVEPIMVVAQLEVGSLFDVAQDESRGPRQVVHLGFTRDAAIQFARRLVKAANLIE